MRRQQGVASHVWAYRAIAEDEVREDREHRATRGALDAPDGDPTQTDPEVMRVTREAVPSATGCLVFQLKAKGQHEGEDTFDKGLAIAKQLKVSGFILEINGEGAVFASLASSVAHGSSSGQMVGATDDPR